VSKLKIALYKRISEIVSTEKRYFNFLDFVPEFIVDGQIYQISGGTFRNYVSELVRAEKVEVVELGQRALHDIRLRFEVKGMYDIFSSQYKKSLNSNDIPLPRWTINDLEIIATVHSTDTVSIVIACSFCPVAVDVNGVVILSNALATTKERISNLANSMSIPDHMSWIVTMRHFGVDSTITYIGEKFYASWEVGQHALITVNSKD